MPLPWGEGGPPDGGTGEGSVADRAALLGGMRLLATTRLADISENFWQLYLKITLVNWTSGIRWSQS